MAHFYGQVEGGRGVVTRVGNKVSGIKSSVQSYGGSIITQMTDDNGNTMVGIEISEGSEFNGTRYFYGTIDELKERLRA